ncbi:MAG TPA: GNAT family N-acetyltransferase [Microthrixaceae bacterium]|nr:GNAT family N-acetyltransferase [Microthrixaceae bacterium]HMT23295.1 GNAT family N-acetyltransferase [Microthrixaceae bacterium]
MSPLPRELSVRDLTPADLDRVLELNEAEVPKVGSLDSDRLRQLWPLCRDRFGVGVVPDAFCLTLGPGTAYWSANYRWVSERFESFVYLDRVCVAPAAQRRGIGQAMYRAVERRAAADQVDWFVLEVNSRPANVESLAFHERLGFAEVGRGEPYGDGAEVVYLARDLRADRPVD